MAGGWYRAIAGGALRKGDLVVCVDPATPGGDISVSVTVRRTLDGRIDVIDIEEITGSSCGSLTQSS
jgi:hypothetical protein